jgi:hypothetical protein
MATTRKPVDDARIAGFFRKRVLPLAAQLRSSRKDLFPLAPDPEATTYYDLPWRRSMRPTDFLQVSGLSAETLEAKLRALWEARGVPELGVLAADFALLAADLAREASESDEEISPFVYVMY